VRKSAHGLRELTATRAVEKGLTPADLDAMFSWLTAAWRANIRERRIASGSRGQGRTKSGTRKART